MARYQTYLAGEKKIIVVSRYAGKVVRGVAKCAPDDAFDMQKGEELARLRCDEKIAEKRVARSEEAVAAAVEALAAAQKRLDAMKAYNADAVAEYAQVHTELAALEAKL